MPTANQTVSGDSVYTTPIATPASVADAASSPAARTRPLDSRERLGEHAVVLERQSPRLDSVRRDAVRFATSAARSAASLSTRSSAAATAAGSCRSTSSPSSPALTISRVPGGAGRDDRNAARHRLDEDVAETFIPRREREDVGPGDVLPRVDVKAAQMHGVAEARVPESTRAAPVPDRPDRG